MSDYHAATDARLLAQIKQATKGQEIASLIRDADCEIQAHEDRIRAIRQARSLAVGKLAAAMRAARVDCLIYNETIFRQKPIGDPYHGSDLSITRGRDAWDFELAADDDAEPDTDGEAPMARLEIDATSEVGTLERGLAKIVEF
jgi:hypothetical protein